LLCYPRQGYVWDYSSLLILLWTVSCIEQCL